MSKHDEICIKNEEFCIKNKELCIKNKELLLKMMNFAGAGLGIYLSPQETQDLRWVLGGLLDATTQRPRVISFTDFNRLLVYPAEPTGQQYSKAITPLASVKAVAEHLAAMLRRHGVHMRKAFASFDRNGDGAFAIGRIFISYCRILIS